MAALATNFLFPAPFFAACFLVLLALVLALFVWWLVRLVEVCRLPESSWLAAGQSRVAYLLLMVFLGLLGTLIWEFGARRRVRRAI